MSRAQMTTVAFSVAATLAAFWALKNIDALSPIRRAVDI